MRLSAAIPLSRASLDAAFADVVATVEPMPAPLRALLAPNIDAITLGSRVFVSPDRFDDVAQGRRPELLAHELVHVEQWRQHGAVGFLCSYVSDYVRLRILGCDHDTAYRNIGFEWAAYRSASRIVSGR